MRQNAAECGKPVTRMWQNMAKYGKIWQNTAKHRSLLAWGAAACEGRGGVLGDYSFSPPPSPRGGNTLVNPSPTLFTPKDDYEALSEGEGTEGLGRVVEEEKEGEAVEEGR